MMGEMEHIDAHRQPISPQLPLPEILHRSPKRHIHIETGEPITFDGQTVKTPLNKSPEAHAETVTPRLRSPKGSGKSSTRAGLHVEDLPDTNYENLMQIIDEQIKKTIGKAMDLQRRQELVDKILIMESVWFLIMNSTSTRLGTAELDDYTRAIILNILFGVGIISSCASMAIKWLRARHEKEIDGYRAILKEIVTRYGQDAWLAIERERMALPAKILAAGFFRGLDNEPAK